MNCFMLSSIPCFYAICWSAIPTSCYIFNVFYSCSCHVFSSRCMLGLKFAIYHRAASLPSQASSVDVKPFWVCTICCFLQHSLPTSFFFRSIPIYSVHLVLVSDPNNPSMEIDFIITYMYVILEAIWTRSMTKNSIVLWSDYRLSKEALIAVMREH